MATVWIPSLMRDLTDGQERVQLQGKTVGELIAALDRRHPGVQDRLYQGEQIDPAIAVWVDGRIAKLGLWKA
jgi:molybdopterin synthase sulfur carrier subunit